MPRPRPKKPTKKRTDDKVAPDQARKDELNAADELAAAEYNVRAALAYSQACTDYERALSVPCLSSFQLDSIAGIATRHYKLLVARLLVDQGRRRIEFVPRPPGTVEFKDGYFFFVEAGDYGQTGMSKLPADPVWPPAAEVAAFVAGAAAGLSAVSAAVTNDALRTELEFYRRTGGVRWGY